MASVLKRCFDGMLITASLFYINGGGVTCGPGDTGRLAGENTADDSCATRMVLAFTSVPLGFISIDFFVFFSFSLSFSSFSLFVFFFFILVMILL